MKKACPETQGKVEQASTLSFLLVFYSQDSHWIVNLLLEAAPTTGARQIRSVLAQTKRLVKHDADPDANKAGARALAPIQVRADNREVENVHLGEI